MRLLFVVYLSFFSVASFGKCVQLFYDGMSHLDKTSIPVRYTQTHFIFLQNLIGHFPHIDQIAIPVEKYEKGMLDRCEANIYLGTFFDNKIPDDFIKDVKETSSQLAWVGYNIWQLTPQGLLDFLGLSYKKQATVSYDSLDKNGEPGFFRFFSYKGEEFKKFGTWDKERKNYICGFEISEFDILDPSKAEVLSWGKHSTSGKESPYIFRKNNFFYVGDSPFSFMTEEDRYLIFADLLFDILKEKPRHPVKKALFRIEDIHVRSSWWSFVSLTDYLHTEKVPYSVALIPIFSDPLKSFDGLSEYHELMDENPYFSEYLRHMLQNKASFIYHGVTHQYGEKRNPFNAMSGDDFEFWDAQKNEPVAEDSADFVINRLHDGYKVFESIDIPIAAWEVPHYQASAFDYTLFGQLFSWQVGRIIYFPHERKNWKRLSEDLVITNSDKGENERRRLFFQDLSLKTHSNLPSGQMFPYEIYGDVYDQRVIPENVGNFQPYISEHVKNPRNLIDLKRVVKRNKVLRDVWASFFVHLNMLSETKNMGLGEFRGDLSSIRELIETVKESGYEFVDLNQFVREYNFTKRNPTTYPYLEDHE